VKAWLFVLSLCPFVLALGGCGASKPAALDPEKLGPEERAQFDCVSQCRAAEEERALCTQRCSAAERARDSTELAGLEAGCLVWDKRENRCITQSSFADAGADR